MNAFSRCALPLLACSLAAACKQGEARQMPQAEYEKLVSESVAYLEERQDSLAEEFELDSFPEQRWDQRAGTLTFSRNGKPEVVADIQFVGSVSKTAKTWLWAWDNPTVRDDVKEAARSVRAYGERYGIARLTEATWPAEEKDGWEMTAVSARVLNAKGGYRSQDGDGTTFLLITGIRRADEAPRADSAPPPAPAPPPPPPPAPEPKEPDRPKAKQPAGPPPGDTTRPGAAFERPKRRP